MKGELDTSHACPSNIVHARAHARPLPLWVPAPVTFPEPAPLRVPTESPDKPRHIDRTSLPRLRELAEKVWLTATSIRHDVERVGSAAVPEEAPPVSGSSPSHSSGGCTTPPVTVAGDTNQCGWPEPLWLEMPSASDRGSSESSAPGGPGCLPRRFLLPLEPRGLGSSHGVGSDSVPVPNVVAVPRMQEMLALIDELMSIYDAALSGRDLEAMCSRAFAALMRPPFGCLFTQEVLDRFHIETLHWPHIPQPGTVMTAIDVLINVYEIQMQDENPASERGNKGCDVSDVSVDEQVFCRPHVLPTTSCRAEGVGISTSKREWNKGSRRSWRTSSATILDRIEQVERQLDFERWNKAELTARFERLFREEAEAHARDIAALECALRGSKKREAKGSSGSEPTGWWSESSTQIPNETCPSLENSSVSGSGITALQTT